MAAYMTVQANARYVFVAFSFNHFPFDDFARLNEVIRVGNKVAQQLRYEYFWISASCMGISDPKSALSGEERRVIQERDVRSHQPKPSSVLQH
jgi:hypothetical protein